MFYRVVIGGYRYRVYEVFFFESLWVYVGFLKRLGECICGIHLKRSSTVSDISCEHSLTCFAQGSLTLRM